MRYTINASDLDRLITIQERSTELDQYGQSQNEWVDLYCNVPCGIDEKKGGEVWETRQEVGNLTTDFKMRYIPGITPRMRLVFEGEIYDIKRVMEITRRKGIVIQAQWKDNKGAVTG